jgi:3-isopropylmalate/(R)-2-methylmalate dehydratase small subunit
MTVAGRAWCFGAGVSTDLIMPGPQVLAGHGAGRPPEQWCFEAIRPGWAAAVRPGDIIVAGANFGCGSARNSAPLLKKLGISAVVADSVARTFFRNAVNTALPVLTCAGVSRLVSDGDRLRVDVTRGTVTNETTGRHALGEPLPPGSPPMQILAAGGFHGFLELVRTGWDPRCQGLVPGSENPGKPPAADGIT